VLFVRRQLRLTHPLLDLTLFRRRTVTAVLIALLLAGSALAGGGLVVTQYLQSVLGYPPARAAILFAPMALALAVSTMLAPVLARRVRPGTAIAAGLAVAAAGFVLLAGARSDGGLGFVIAGVAVVAVGTGPLFALGTGLVIAAVPRERAGGAASLSETANQLGGTLGIALMGTVTAAVYQRGVDGAVPAGLPADVARSARQTMAGAIATHDAGLLGVARTAYTHGLTAVGLGCAGLFLGLAALVAISFRVNPGPGQKPSSA
jgi:MFS transporter, DHA2 family, multidrug resistance protein